MLQSFNEIMDYIELHIEEDLKIDDLAKKAGLSVYHLKRTFSFIAGISIGEYIKNRKFTLANEQLIQKKNVTDVALRFGYQTVEGFSRAFREWSGYLPSEVIKNNIQQSYFKLSFYIDIRGGEIMEFKIEHKEAFNIVGVKASVPIQFEGENNHIVNLAESITNQQKAEMHRLKGLYPNQIINASYNFDDKRLEEKGQLTHMIGFLTTEDNTFEDLEQVNVEKHTWTIFPNTGPFPNTLQDTWAKIYSEWLPSSKYELVKAPEISFTQFDSSQDNVYSEIWLAVKEK
ncbi:AraC family transcriptional regulator [Ruoffia sp. FAM 26255]|uniref:AraC family transcriptional regulator n=1 Tax=Ruoffia sp. FAM 26255 TaxID=3259519 RepID=UPI003889F02C